MSPTAVILAFLFGAFLGLIVGAGIRWGVIAADFRRRFYGDGPNLRIWWNP